MLKTTNFNIRPNKKAPSPSRTKGTLTFVVPPCFSIPIQTRRGMLSLQLYRAYPCELKGCFARSPTGSGATFGQSCHKGLSAGDPCSLLRQRSVLLLSFIALYLLACGSIIRKGVLPCQYD